MQPFADDDTRPIRLPVCVQAVRSCRPAITRVTGPGIGQSFAVPEGSGAGLLLGRGSGCDVRVEDDTVSREHVRIWATEEGVAVLTDLGSTNGTIVNGRPVTEVVLAEGDKIQLGRGTVFRFCLHDRLDEDYLEHLYQTSIHDPLTGLFNRRHLLECLDRDLGLTRRHGMPIGLVAIDVDDFKSVNDRHGHAGGDEVLRAVASLLQDMQRSESILARYGGEEFAVLLRNVEPRGVEVFAERMRSAVAAAELDLGGVPIRLTISLGVAVTSTDGVATADALIERADRYLYLSKRRGRNRVTSRARVSGGADAEAAGSGLVEGK